MPSLTSRAKSPTKSCRARRSNCRNGRNAAVTRSQLTPSGSLQKCSEGTRQRKPVILHGSQRHSIVVDNRRRSLHAWRDRVRDPVLTVLLVLELCLVFLAAPLAAKGLPMARPIIETMVMAGGAILG